ncbi:MAG: Hsp70 family protein [Deltaproteobacteria bacterium]|nr:Hsp70 family protein [Deltaproteobacteria bacterium]
MLWLAMAPVLGIDFGTTNTAAAYFDANGKLKLVPVRDKVFVMPSVAWYRAADKAVVGHAARSQIVDDPRHTIFEAKRFLGRRYQSEYVARHREKFAYELVEGEDGYCAFHVYGQVKPLTDVARQVVSHIVEQASNTLGGPFTECVMGVPAHASVRQREALRVAVEKAGLKLLAMVNEPTAAALYYANLRNPEQTVLVFDLGGGTLDATVMSVNNRVVNVLATGGDAFLGGANFDELIVENLVDRFREQYGVELRSNTVVMQRLMFAAESAKIALSKGDSAHLRVPCIVQKDEQFLHFDFNLTRTEVEQLCFKLIERVAATVDDVLERAKLKPDQIDELVLVGGQTRMPAIRERLKHFKRFSSEKDVHPELGVAIGAAILGRNLARGASGLADVVPMSINLMLPGGRTVEAIPANTPLPAKLEIPLEGLPTWNAPVPVVLFESLDSTSTEREILGTIQVGAEWRVSGTPKLELTMGQDFVIGARLLASSGSAVAVTIVDAKPQSRR